MMPSVAKRRKIASIRCGGSFAPPSNHQVSTAMYAPATYWTIRSCGTAAAECLLAVAASSPRTASEIICRISAKGDGATAAAGQCSEEILMASGMFEHGEAEAQTLAAISSQGRGCILGSMDEQSAQMLI